MNKLLRVPQRLPTRAMLIGTLQKLENVQNILVIVEDDEGCWILQEADNTLERMNWMLDRAKRMLHDRVMWPFGQSFKMTVHPLMLSDDEPIPFDESCYEIEVVEREK